MGCCLQDEWWDYWAERKDAEKQNNTGESEILGVRGENSGGGSQGPTGLGSEGPGGQGGDVSSAELAPGVPRDGGGEGLTWFKDMSGPFEELTFHGIPITWDANEKKWWRQFEESSAE